MQTMERKQPRRRRSFTPEIVQRYRANNGTIGQIARDFDRPDRRAGLGTQAETDAGTGRD